MQGNRFETAIAKPIVLAVDDSEANLIALEVVLKEVHCEYVPVTSGQKALDFLKTNSHRTAVVLLDAHMPIMDGYGTARALQKNPDAKKIPVIFLTAMDNNQEAIQKAYDVGAVDFIFKPFNPEILLKKVSVFLELYKSRIQTAENEKRVYENRLKLVTDSVPALIAYVDKDLKYQFVNAELEKWFDRSRSEILGKKIGELLGPEGFAQYEPLIEKARKGQAVAFEIQIPSKNGASRESKVSILPDFNPQGVVEGLVIHASDISQSKKTEKVMSDLIGRFQSLFESIPQIVFIANPDGTVRQFNSKWYEYTGEPVSSLNSRPMHEFIHPEDANRVFGTWDEVKSTLQTWTAEYRLRRHDGAYRWQLARSVPIIDSQDQLVTWIGTVTDIEDQKQAYEEQKAAQEDLIATLETMTEGYLVFDTNYLLTHANSETEKFLGIAKNELLGKKAEELFPSPDRLKFQAHYDRIMQTGVPERFTESYEGRWLQVHAYRSRNGGVSIFHRDITEQKNAQDRIVESERLLEKVFNESPICKAVVMGPQFVFNRANEKYYELIGRRDIIGKKAADVLPDLQGQSFLKILNEVYYTQKTYYASEMPVSIGLPNGKTRSAYMDIYYQPLLDAKGNTFGILAQGTDITEKVHTKQKLAASHFRSEFLAKASSVLNSSLDVDTILRQLADITVPEMADWCSIQIREANGQMKQVAVSHKDPEKVKWAWEIQKKYPSDQDSDRGTAQVAKTGKAEIVNGISHEMLKQAAQDPEHEKLLMSIGFYSFMCVPIRTREHIIGTMSLISTTESNRNYNEDDLALAQEIGVRAGVAADNARLYVESQKINRIKDEFLATLSHELRTPLNVIQGHAEILKSELGEISAAQLKDSIDAIYRNAHTQTALVGDLLDVSSIITGKISFNPQRISPVDTFESIYASLKPTADAKNIKLSCEIKRAPVYVTADPTRLHQILWNLASNALKFTQSGGEVKMSLKSQDSQWTIEVLDTGLGIDPEFLPFIFDRFTQEDSSRTRRFGGLGLGLSIVKYLAELHGGQAEAFSEGKNKGSLFRVSLPLAFKAEGVDLSRSPADFSSAQKGSLLKEFKILLVEDSEDNRLLIKRILEKFGAQVIDTESAQEARESLKRYQPDLIVSDIGMPEENGLDFIRGLRKSEVLSQRKIPAIALTAYAREEDKQAAISAGFQSHVTKPINEQTLVAEIFRVTSIH